MSIDSSGPPSDRARLRALVRLVKRLRHDLATPLSAAAIHLEVVSRRFEDAPAKAFDSLRVAQRETGTAAAMLDVLSEVLASAEEEGSPYPLDEAVTRGASRLTREGVVITPPADVPSRTLVGSSTRLADGVAAMASLALERTREGGTVSFQAEDVGSAIRLVCSFEGSLPGKSPEQLFGLSQPDLCLARFTIESLGGSLTAEQREAEGRLTAVFPVEGS